MSKRRASASTADVKALLHSPHIILRGAERLSVLVWPCRLATLEAVNKLMRARRQVDPVVELEQAASAIEYHARELRKSAEEMRAAMKKMPKESEAAE